VSPAQESEGALGRPSWLSAALLFAPLSLLGEVILARTNHRPLGAVTFATVALLAWPFAELVTRRLFDAEVNGARARKWMWGVSCTLAAIVVGRALI